MLVDTKYFYKKLWIQKKNVTTKIFLIKLMWVIYRFRYDNKIGEQEGAKRL